MLIINAKEKKNSYVKCRGEDAAPPSWVCHPGARVIVGVLAFLCALVLILVVPVPISRGGVVVAVEVAVSFPFPSLSPAVAVPGVLVVLWSVLVFVPAVVSWLSPSSHLPPLCEQLLAAVLGRDSCPVPIVLACRAFILLVVGFHPRVTTVVGSFVVGVGVVPSHPAVFVVVASLPFRHCALSLSSLCHFSVSTPRGCPRSDCVCAVLAPPPHGK